MQLTFCFRVDILEHGRFEHGLVALAAAQQPGAGLHASWTQSSSAGLLLVDHRADKVFSSFGSPRSGSSSPRRRLAETIVEVLLDEDALHADAALAGLIKRAEDHALDDEVEAVAWSESTMQAALPPSSSTTSCGPRAP
jgi:hypothetical protein